MGRKSKTPILDDSSRLALEQGYKSSHPQFGKRCLIVLLKAKGLTSNDVAELLSITDQAVNSWIKKYNKLGIDGLQTKLGQGRKPILNVTDDEQKIRVIIEKERQRLKLVKEEIEESCNKEFSLLTLKRFLKNLSADGNGLG